MELARQERLFAAFVKEYTGRDMEYHLRYQTTGMGFAFACWRKGVEVGKSLVKGTENGESEPKREI
jgi:hypothetical protein